MSKNQNLLNNAMMHTNITFNHVNSNKLVAQLGTKFKEVDDNLKTAYTSIVELTDLSFKYDKLITQLTDKATKSDEQNVKLLQRTEELEHKTNELKTKLSNYEQLELKIAMLETTLKPIYDTYISIKDVLTCNWCDYSSLAGENEVIYFEN